MDATQPKGRGTKNVVRAQRDALVENMVVKLVTGISVLLDQ